MSRKKGKNFYSDMYWQSAEYNQRMYWQFRNHLIMLAVSRFRWLNLPKTCDERYLEQTLLFQGCATIAHPKHGKYKDYFFSNMIANNAKPNIYDNYTTWTAYGINNWNFKCDATNGVVVWDNKLRQPIFPMLDMYARELTDIMRTKQVNRMHIKNPIILSGPEEKKQDMMNIYKMQAGNEPAIVTTNGFSSMDYNVLTTGVPFLGEELSQDLLNTWNQIYKFLGIKTTAMKRERQIYGEMEDQHEPDNLTEWGYIAERRKAADMLNERFGLNIQVVRAEDLQSENFNYLGKIEKSGKQGSGNNGMNPTSTESEVDADD